MIPIIPVYMGLADTRSVLRREAGLTRTVENSMVPLGGLTPQESREYVQRIQSEYLGLTGGVGQSSALYRWLVNGGDDWPQHLRSQNAAVAEAMLKADSRSLDDLDLEARRACLSGVGAGPPQSSPRSGLRAADDPFGRHSANKRRRLLRVSDSLLRPVAEARPPQDAAVVVAKGTER